MRRTARIALKFAFAGVALSLVFYFVPVTDVGSRLRAAAPEFLLLGVCLQFLLRAIATLRLHVITADQGIALNHFALFRILLATQFYALLLPGTLAGGGATWMKYVQAGANANAAAAAVVLNRGVGTLITIVVGASAWWFDRDDVQPAAVAGVIGVGAALLYATFFLRFPKWPAAVESGTASRRVRELVNRLLQFQRVSLRGKTTVIVSSLIHELAATGATWSFAAAVGIAPEFLTVLWLRAALQIVLMLPLSIGGLGIREASLVGLGALVGVPPATAVAWSLLIFLGGLVVAAAGGLIEANAAARSVSAYEHGKPAQRAKDAGR
jgi:hypothetical protein